MTRFAALIILASLCAGCVHTQDGEGGYAVVWDGAIAMEKLPIERGNQYPWLDQSKILFWSCGFARLTYKEVDVVAFLAGDDDFATKDSSFYYMMGEWCEVADALMETSGRAAHVISYFNWRGKKYLLFRANVYLDNEGTAYVADKTFVEWNELQSLVRPIAQGEDNQGCFDLDRELPELLDDAASLATVGELRCATKGVRLKDFKGVRLKDFVVPASGSLKGTPVR
jgi:hypothetical protein